MRKSNLLSIFILILAGMLSVPCFLTETIAQDRMPVCSPLGKTAKRIKRIWCRFIETNEKNVKIH